MNMQQKLRAYANSSWLVNGELFQPFVNRAVMQPCPSAKDVGKLRKRLDKAASTLEDGNAGISPPLRVYGFEAGGYDDPLELATQAEAPRAIRAIKGKVGVIPIYGPVDQKMSGELMKAGGTPLDFVSAALDSLLGNSGVGAIVLRMDTPGGSISGVQELSDKIFAARAEKPIYAIADSTAASAGLWLAAAATMFVATPGGGGSTVGSHGVYTMHVDESAAMEAEGVKVTMVSAGKYKTEFSPYGPISDESKAEAQAKVNNIYGEFTASLAKFRDKSPGHVRDNFGQGRMLTSAQALSVGMIDRILSFQSLMAKLTGVGVGSTGPSAEKLLLLHEYESDDDAA